MHVYAVFESHIGETRFLESLIFVSCYLVLVMSRVHGTRLFLCRDAPGILNCPE